MFSNKDTAVGEGSRSAQQGSRPENTAALLASHFIGTFRASVSKLILSTAGRSLQEEGVDTLLKSITQDGWVTSVTPVVTLEDASYAEILTRENSIDLKFRVVDGNHRVAALKRVDERDGSNTVIDVQVYRTLEERTERIIASRE